MKLRRTLRFHSLRKGKVRMTWNKYNLYNLSNVERKIPNFIRRTFFQQKWSAKALTRAYHGEHIKEQKWTRMFDRRLRSVVDMNPQYMAANDGAEQATGRGSGRDIVTREDVTPWAERAAEAKEREKRREEQKQQDLQQELEDAIEEGREQQLLAERAEKERLRDAKKFLALTDPSADDTTKKQNLPNYQREFLPEDGWQMRQIFEPPADRHEVSLAAEEEEASTQTQGGHGSHMGSGGHEMSKTRAAHNTQMGPVDRTPYMNMSYAPIERRIDVAIFRAMFASSTRQARNLVIHGKVKVNGQPMNHATYLLNPGDMFQVEPDAVMYATGKIKKKSPPPPSAKRKNKGRRKRKLKAANEDGTDEAAAPEAEAAAPEADEGPLEPDESALEAQADADPKEVQKRLRLLASETRKLLSDTHVDQWGAKEKQRMRAFMKDAKAISSQLGRKGGETTVTNDVMALINEAFKSLVHKDPSIAATAEKSGAFTPGEVAAAVADADAGEDAEEDSELDETLEKMTEMAEDIDFEERYGSEAEEEDESEMDKLQSSLKGSEDDDDYFEKLDALYGDNPVDDSKPYHTPWRPRPFMGAFAFIPRYLEVNQNICAAVYLRHPVARQGIAEIPSPFPPHVQELAFNWYLRRR